MIPIALPDCLTQMTQSSRRALVPQKGSFGQVDFRLNMLATPMSSSSYASLSLQNHSLNVDDMPVTRSQSRNPHIPMASRDADRERWDPLSRPPARLPPIRTQTGLTTNLDGFNGRLSPHILVERVATKMLDRGSYCAIQLNPVSVRIYDSHSSSGQVECTCDAFRTTGETCVHIQVKPLQSSCNGTSLICVVAHPWSTQHFLPSSHIAAYWVCDAAQSNASIDTS